MHLHQAYSVLQVQKPANNALERTPARTAEGGDSAPFGRAIPASPPAMKVQVRLCRFVFAGTPLQMATGRSEAEGRQGGARGALPSLNSRLRMQALSEQK